MVEYKYLWRLAEVDGSCERGKLAVQAAWSSIPRLQT